MAEYQHTREFRGASFFEADLSGSRFHSCDLRRVKVTDSWLTDLSVSGLIERVIVNDVDVTGYVQSELDSRYPERVQARALKTPDDYRAMWDTLERLWGSTVALASTLPEASLYEQVDGEWSFTETMRHLVFATDAWAGRPILDQECPFHPLGLPHSVYPRDDAAKLGLDVTSSPSFAEVMDARADRMALVRRLVDGLTVAEVGRVCTRTPAPGYPEDAHTVAQCLAVIVDEECEHRRYAVRDLAVLSAR
jgi:DinB superfamily/Pentapeptide repeats (8 copies)